MENNSFDDSKKSKSDVGDETKQSTEDGNVQEIRMLIENSQVGGIIGKAGANVKHVREEAGVFVSILKAEYPNVQERILVLKGTTAQIANGIQLIAELLVEAAQQKDKSSNSSENTTSIRLLVHRSAVGAVIGKAGAVIKETQTETGARLQVSNEPLPQSTEKTVTISGSPQAIYEASSRVLSQLAENPIRSGVKVYSYVPGQPAFNVPAYNIPNAFSPPVGMFAHPFSALGQSAPISTQKIAIPTVTAGCVIGRGGAVIRDLRAQSQTNISIADPEQSSSDERVVTLTGTQQGIQTAIFLIRQLVEQFQPQQNY